MGWFYDFMFGKVRKVTLNLRPAKAEVTMEDGTIHVVTRTGDAWESAIGYTHFTGEYCLEQYLSGKIRSILVDDAGQMFPVCKIAKIKTTLSDEYKTVEYR